MTADELLTLPGEGRRELVEGVLHEMAPAGGDHGIVASQIGAQLHAYRQQHGGRAFAAEPGFVLGRDPDTVRAPDAAYVGPERARTVGRSPGFWPGPPDLAVEVVSPADTYTEVHEKALGWISAGCTVVLVVDPAARHVTRYRAPGDVVAFSGDEQVDCAPAMPCFTLAADALVATIDE